jgi:hypothetical protein
MAAITVNTPANPIYPASAQGAPVVECTYSATGLSASISSSTLTVLPPSNPSIASNPLTGIQPQSPQAQSATIAPAGVYVLIASLNQSGTTGSGTVSMALGYTQAGVALTPTAISSVTLSSGANGSCVLPIVSDGSAAITFSTTFSAGSGGKYDIDLVLLRVL